MYEKHMLTREENVAKVREKRCACLLKIIIYTAEKHNLNCFKVIIYFAS